MLSIVFEYKYMWHVTEAQFWILRGGFTAGVLVIIALWVFFPSYVVVAIVGLLTLLFPVILFPILFGVEQSPSLSSWKLSFVVTATVGFVFLFATTALRRRQVKEQKGQYGTD